MKHRGTGWFDVAGWRLADRAHPAGGIVLADDGHPAGTALCCLPAVQAAVLHEFLARHGNRDGLTVRAPAGAQVRGRVPRALAHGCGPRGGRPDLRAALPS